eukprot:TRINITY_DN18279_c0_g1_i1.p1 TRINITY_DN18279_c0_g1~~TRINITY_DN18279_c0_g1_i1.p1  ORF type:complete len:151 (+),score=26.98 TRINITY_DN18279_c0_g1_i1:83-535(+)
MGTEEQSTHAVLGTNYRSAPPEGMSTSYFGMGCFWGGEEAMWKQAGVHTTSVGFMGTPKAEVVQVVYDANKVTYDQLLSVFWSSHDPKAHKANPIYRSMLFVNSDQMPIAKKSVSLQEGALTQIAPISEYEFAEERHQQYNARNASSCKA